MNLNSFLYVAEIERCGSINRGCAKSLHVSVEPEHRLEIPGG